MIKKPYLKQKATDFGQAVHADIQRSTFWRNSGNKTTFNAGKLVPIYCDEVLPGDTFEMDLSYVSRMTTPIFPTMDNLDLEFYAFFVPNRLVWDGWEELMGENKTGAWAPSAPPASVPKAGTIGGYVAGAQIEKRIGNYYGIPIGAITSEANGGIPVSLLPLRGYGLIWNEWFRDENLQAPMIINKGGSSATLDTLYKLNSTLFTVNKPFDYFTGCLPEPQKGESQLIPIELNELIPVITGDVLSAEKLFNANGLKWGISTGGNAVAPSVDVNLGIQNSSGVTGYEAAPDSDWLAGQVLPSNLWADGSGQQINATTISELRTAFQIQKLFERDARGGTRYIEMLKAHFGVEAEDYRLQRPEYLGSHKTIVGMEQVPQTSSSDEMSPQGNLSAFSQTVGRHQPIINKSFVEHGFIHIFAVARQRKTYQQGLHKMWTRSDRLDYYFPVLANISEQPVYNYEIMCTGENPKEIFGYNEAWAEYRYKPSMVTGDMQSNATNSLDVWHYADFYEETPTLSAGWIKDNSDINVNRTLAVDMADNDQILLDIAFTCKCTRPMPVQSIPGMVDHF